MMNLALDSTLFLGRTIIRVVRLIDCFPLAASRSTRQFLFRYLPFHSLVASPPRTTFFSGSAPCTPVWLRPSGWSSLLTSPKGTRLRDLHPKRRPRPGEAPFCYSIGPPRTDDRLPRFHPRELPRVRLHAPARLPRVVFHEMNRLGRSLASRETRVIASAPFLPSRLSPPD